MKPLAKWLIALAVVLVVLVIGDRVAVVLAENKAVSTVKDSGDVTGVEIDIHGFPFLTQAIGGELSHVTGAADAASFGGLSVSDVQVEARGMSISAPYPVATGEASGSVSVPSLQALLAEATGLDLALESDGGSLKASGNVLGTELTIGVIPEVADPSALGVTISSVQMGGVMVAVDALPPFISERLSDIRVGLDLPEGIALDSVVVDGDAVRVSVSGTDVSMGDLVDS